MKKIILTIAVIAFIANMSNAQNNKSENNDYRKQFQFGLKIGANYSNVYDTKGEEFQADPKFGLATGAFVAIPLGTFIGLQPELLFSQKGFQATGRILGSDYKFTRTTSYIDVPILFAFKPSEFLTILAGPQYSYLLNQRDVFANASTSIEQELEFENENIRRNTFCFQAGADINIKHLVIGVRAGWDILNNNGDGTTTTPRYKNVWYQVTIGYRFINE
jgi:hypothetical protein